MTILCDSSSVRLVSSGKFENSVTVHVQEARDEDMNYDKNIVMMCPGYIWRKLEFRRNLKTEWGLIFLVLFSLYFLASIRDNKKTYAMNIIFLSSDVTSNVVSKISNILCSITDYYIWKRKGINITLIIEMYKKAWVFLSSWHFTLIFNGLKRSWKI